MLLLKPSNTDCPSTSSLMESFVPLGGYFSTPPNLAAPLGSTYGPFSRCKLCSDKCEQEVAAVLTVGRANSQSDQHQASLPAWLQSTEGDTNNGLDLAKAKDDKTELHAKVAVLQKKWNDICQCLHHNSSPVERDVTQVGSQAFPCIMGFPVAPERKERVDNHANTVIDASPIESVCDSALAKLQPKTSAQGVTLSIPVDSRDKSESSPDTLHQKPSKYEANPAYSLSVVLDGHGSPCSAASVTTDLGLGTLYSFVQDPNHPTIQDNEEVDEVKEKPLRPQQLQFSSCTGPNSVVQFDSTDFKLFWKSLKEKVGRQDEAVYAVSRTVALCRSGKERRLRASVKGDIWLSFHGSDMVTKKKLAIALAEMLFGSRESVICVDLACPDGISPPNSIFRSKKMNGFDTSFRGSFIVDYIYSEIRKNPLSVVFLENVDKADTGMHNCLVHAIQTGKFIDSRGREISINNSVFAVTSSDFKSNETFSFRKETSKFSEEKMLASQSWQMQILIRNDPEYCTTALRNNSNVFMSSRNASATPAFLNKRKLIETMETAKRIQKTSNKCLDLNLPVEVTSEDSTLASLDNLTNLVDECVVFEPFDLDSLASDILKKMDERYKNTIGNEGFLEVDSQAMEQILAAAWFCDSRNALDNWVEHVLGNTFAEARERYSVGAGTVLKLVSCEGLPMQDQASEVYLPAKIILQ
ncbi:protein DWARF 53-LIKE-like [Papaver somniferum]|uniref:protein DWARF 53-LIKE-like n=1 Tax=Papaver somniferum TaxID=3469 RepID=UPI000E6F6113|nr:protein DWARF 53-LIKE-like [Papaver somniferum]